jgi:hypothetical protein
VVPKAPAAARREAGCHDRADRGAAAAGTGASGKKATTTPRPSLRWADLLRRVYDIDIRTCPNCGLGTLEPIATILDPDAIARELSGTEPGLFRAIVSDPGSVPGCPDLDRRVARRDNVRDHLREPGKRGSTLVRRIASPSMQQAGRDRVPARDDAQRRSRFTQLREDRRLARDTPAPSCLAARAPVSHAPVLCHRNRRHPAVAKAGNLGRSEGGGEEGDGMTLTLRGAKPPLERRNGMVFVSPIEPGRISRRPTNGRCGGRCRRSGGSRMALIRDIFAMAPTAVCRYKGETC